MPLALTSSFKTPTIVGLDEKTPLRSPESLNLSLAFTLVEEIEDPVTLLKPVIGLEVPNESLQSSFPLLVEVISSKFGACVGSLPSLDAPS